MEKIHSNDEDRLEAEKKLEEMRSLEIEGDRKMTEFEEVLVAIVRASMFNFLKKYNIEYSDDDLILDNILIVKSEEKKDGCVVGGKYEPFSKKIILYLADYENSPYFITILAHELFHQLSHLSLKLRLTEKGNLAGDHSLGLSMQSEDQGVRVQLFGKIDEAFTEILVERLIRNISEELLTGLQKAYPEEKETLLKLISHINNGEKLNGMKGKSNLSEDEVFDIFIKAYFKGEILPLARLFEEHFGKGWFRKMGEAYSIVG